MRALDFEAECAELLATAARSCEFAADGSWRVTAQSIQRRVLPAPLHARLLVRWALERGALDLAILRMCGFPPSAQNTSALVIATYYLHKTSCGTAGPSACGLRFASRSRAR